MAFDLQEWVCDCEDYVERMQELESSLFSEWAGGPRDQLQKALDAAGATAELVEAEGGVDEGYDYHRIWKFSAPGKEDSYWKLHGYHRSHDGTYFQGFHRVKIGKIIRYEWEKVSGV